MNNMLNKYPDGTGESGTSVPKPIDTGLVTNLESENRNSLKTENQLSLAVGQFILKANLYKKRQNVLWQWVVNNEIQISTIPLRQGDGF